MMASSVVCDMRAPHSLLSVSCVTRSILAPCTISPNHSCGCSRLPWSAPLSGSTAIFTESRPEFAFMRSFQSASALLVMLAGELGSGTPDHAAASRIIQGIVGGIGFLGAGVILGADKGNRVYHITTAATIWVTAALGTACGLGAWRVAALASVLVLVVLTLGLWLDRVLFRHGEPDEDIGPS